MVPFADVPEIFDWLELQGIKVAACTHSWKPAWAAEVFNLLETNVGTKYSDLLAHPIGTKVGTKTKDALLKALATEIGCSCQDMVFFDDKAHNVSDAKKAGVTSCLTDAGLTWAKFVQCLKQFEQKKTGNAEDVSSQPKAHTPAMPKNTSPAAPKLSGMPTRPSRATYGLGPY